MGLYLAILSQFTYTAFSKRTSVGAFVCSAADPTNYQSCRTSKSCRFLQTMPVLPATVIVCRAEPRSLRAPPRSATSRYLLSKRRRRRRTLIGCDNRPDTTSRTLDRSAPGQRVGADIRRCPHIRTALNLCTAPANA